MKTKHFLRRAIFTTSTLLNAVWVLTASAQNTAPILDATKSPVLSAINEDAGAPAGAVGTLVSSLVDLTVPAGQLDNVNDPDPGALAGMAVTGADSANGTWYYTLNGGTIWSPLGAVADVSARLLAADADNRLYFQPNANYNGTLASAITFRAWDRTSGSDGGTASTSPNGGTTAFSTASDTASLTITPVNDAPVLDGTKSPTLSAVSEDAPAPVGAVGTPVSTLVDFASPAGGLDNVVDVDSGALLGIAIVGADNANGTWYYSLDGGSVWSALPAVADTSALLIVADTNHRLYFQPNADFNGTIASAIAFRAWDRTSGADGSLQSTLPNGGTTAFSTATDTASITITAVNDAPVLDNTKSPTLSAISEDAPVPVGAVGTSVSTLVDFASPPGGLDNVVDVDSGALLGIAIVGADNANGTWYYTLNGGATWSPLGAVSDSSARLLAADADNRLYFQPNPGFIGTLATAITFRAWDQTSGTDGNLDSTLSNGGTSAFSTATDTASLIAVDSTLFFSPGTLIIPMDTGTAGQNDGMFRAYGLVYKMLRNGIPVRWVIEPTKAAGSNDFIIDSSGGNAVEDVRTSANVTLPRSYRGGPFVVDGADAAAALPIIQAWQATPGDSTAVHRLTAGSVFMPVERLLVGAPRIAILLDGNEQIAFNDLNAAGILNAVGGIWTALSPDLLTETSVVGPTATNDADGALFHTNGLTRYSFLAAMHYNISPTTPEVVQEVRSWLDMGDLTHAFMQCQSVAAFENNTNGYFLTTAGLQDDGVAPASTTIRVPASPLAQLDGTFTADGGAVDSMGLAGGSFYKTGAQSLINESASPLTQRIVLLTGRMDGDNANGRVTYLGGHDYTLLLPITSNPQANGVRLFLNSILETDVASGGADPDVVLTVSAPALINSNSLTYTLGYVNPGLRPVENLLLTDPLPAGASFVSASGGGTNNGGVVTWALPALAPGASNAVSLTVSVAADGTYTNVAQMRFSHLLVKTIRSAPVTTIRDTVAPAVTIISGPDSYTSDNTPTFDFTVSEPSSFTTYCRIDTNSYVPATSPFTPALPLTEGAHTFEVYAQDAAGNVSSIASFNFMVDTINPVVTIAPPPTNPQYTSDTTPSFQFSVSAGGSPTIVECRIISLSGPPVDTGYIAATSPFTSPVPLADGLYHLLVRATDSVPLVGADTFDFMVDTIDPVVTITGGPAAVTSDSTPTFQFSVSGGGSPTTTYCRVDAGAWEVGVSPFTTIALLDGPHTFDVFATDAAGNTGPPSSFNFTVDTTPPTLTIVPVPPDQVMISWVPNTPGFVLQQAPSLSPMNWTNAPSGTNNPVTIPGTNSAKFFRLMNQ